MFEPTVRERMLAPAPATSALPGIAGRIKERPEDFVVDEIAAYEPDGREERHLMLRVRKRGLSTPEMLRLLGGALGVDPPEMGCAGRKDREAVTAQWVSVPARARARVESFSHPAVEILEAHPHGQKLRTGHLHGNRFRIVVRDPGCDLATAQERVRAKIRALDRGGGLENFYGGQRFGSGGENLDRGLEVLRTGRRAGAGGRFLVSALQSGLFNLYLGLRKEHRWLRQLLPGDVVQRADTGGMFVVEDAGAEQPRLDRAELVLTGPIFGSKMRAAAPESPSARLEEEVLRQTGIPAGLFSGGGKRLPGGRRALQVPVAEFSVRPVEATGDLAGGIELRFALGPGSYATQLLRELQCGPA